ncbi:MAG: hypothetical protein HRT36_08915, partial [Alphaproteobacteria bacterium]|nr:hypothetical protein [Alphaproteobacteria bacterium]
ARGYDVLRQGCPYDFQQLAVEQAVFTRFQHAEILIDHAAEDTVDVMVRASFANYVWDHLAYASDQLYAFAESALDG